MALLLLAAPAFSQTAPDLGSTSTFGVVSETFSNNGATLVDGDVCFTTGTAPSVTAGSSVVTPCPDQTGIDQNAARAELDAQSCTPIGAEVALNDIAIDGGTPGEFPPGCYSSTGAMSIATGESITLSGDGVYIFRPGGALDPAANSSVLTADGACVDNVFWTPGGGTTIGADAAFIGTIFRGTADGLSITLGDSASLEGRMLAFGSTVTTDNNNITVPDECPEPSTGTIIVEKQTNPDGSTQTFDFSGDAVGTLTDGQQIIVDNLAPGDYSSTESVPAGWELTDIVCNDTDSSGEIGTATASFVLDAGETVTCVFVNTEDTATNGTITILKQASPSDTGQLFDFSGDLGPFSLMHGEFIVETLPPGTYAVSETVPAGWQLDSAVCDDGSPVGAIDLEAGESVTCTFANSQLPGTIIVEKQTNPPGSLQSFTFTGDAEGNLTDGEQIIVENLSPGVYNSTESVTQGWELTDIVCDDADSTGDLATATAIFVLDADEMVTCTFNNSQQAGAFSIPIFSRGGITLIILMMMLMAAVSLRHYRLI